MEFIETPNPNAIKMNIHLSKNEYSEDLLSVNGVTSIFYGPGFVTVLKEENIDWASIKEDITKIFDKL